MHNEIKLTLLAILFQTSITRFQKKNVEHKPEV